MDTPRPLKISWSSLRTHEECHQRSFLIREGKRAKVTNIRNFLHGSVVDAVMRDWLDRPVPHQVNMADLVEEYLHKVEATEKESGNIVRWRDADDRENLRRFCIELVTRLEPILKHHVLPHSYEHGKWFKIPMTIQNQQGNPRDIVLTGEMDLLVDDNGPVVWDLKGTADDQYYRKVVAQLTFYDLAIWASTGKKTRYAGLIQPMCAQQVMAWQITDDARRNLMTRIVRYAHDVWAGEQTCTKDSNACFRCDVRHACVRYSSSRLDAFGSLADGLRQAAGEVA